MIIDSKKLVDLKLENSDMIFDCQFHPKHYDWIAFSTLEGDIKIINFQNNQTESVIHFDQHHNGKPIRKIRFFDNLMFSVSKTLKITDIETQKMIRKIPNDHRIYSLKIIDEFLVCIGDDNGSFKVWDYRETRPVHMALRECENYISDLDIDQNKRLVVASSGEGTLTAFNIRARRMEQPQSELFDSGFQCVRFLEEKNKTIVGSEDGVINIFNINEWGNISDRYPVKQNNNGVSSIECMEMIDDEKNCLIIGCSDGSIQAISLFPHRELKTIATNDNSIECLDVNQITKQLVATNENQIQTFSYEIIDDEKKIKKFKKDTGFFSSLVE